jgi:hypothetical protein
MKVGVWVFYSLKNLGGFAPSREKKQPGPRWSGRRFTRSREGGQVGKAKRGEANPG